MTALGNISSLAADLGSFIQEGLEAHSELTEKVRNLEANKTTLRKKLTSLEAKLKSAESKAEAAVKGKSVAEAALAEATAEVTEVRRREAVAASKQGEILHAFAERIVQCGSFSALANRLAEVLNKEVEASTLDKVAEDIPGLDKAKYGYEVVSNDDLLHAYAQALKGRVEAFPGF